MSGEKFYDDEAREHLHKRVCLGFELGALTFSLSEAENIHKDHVMQSIQQGMRSELLQGASRDLSAITFKRIRCIAETTQENAWLHDHNLDETDVAYIRGLGQTDFGPAGAQAS